MRELEYNKVIRESGLNKNDLEICEDYLRRNIEIPVYLINKANNPKAFAEMAKNLSKYNTMRGGVNGFKGFVFEELHATNATINGTPTNIIGNNGPADFSINNGSGKVIKGQAKVGYKNKSVDWSKYKDQQIIVDKGNTQLANKANKAGMDVAESNISGAEAQKLAKQMQFESRITGKVNAPITAHVKSMHSAGIESAKTGAAFGAGISIASNLVDLVNGEKELGEASVAIAKDTVIAAGTSYVVGAATTAIASTTAGAAAGAAVSGAVAATTTAIATSAVGTAVAGTATAAGAAIASSAVGTAAVAASAAVGAAASTAGAAVASTAVGGAAVAAGTAIAGTAVGAAAIAAAPVVLAGAAVGVGVKIFKNLFWD